jgi:hypothetical protein
MEGDYEGDWGFHHPHGLTHELLCASNVGQPRPNISFDPFRGFGTGPGPGLGLERSHNMGFDRAASSQDGNTHNSNREPWGFDRAPRYQHQGNKSCDYSKYLNSGSSMLKPYGEGYDKTVFSYNEISVEQPPVYDIEVEDKIGDHEEESITWESMLPSKTVSIKFVLENVVATTKILQVFKEEMEKQNRLASKISYSTCNSEEMACDLLIKGGCCSLHKKEHHYTLRPKKDTTKSKPMVKMKIIGFPNCWSRQQHILEHCIQGDFDKGSRNSMQSTRHGMINMLMVTSLLLNLEAKFSKREAMMQAELS